LASKYINTWKIGAIRRLDIEKIKAIGGGNLASEYMTLEKIEAI